MPTLTSLFTITTGPLSGASNLRPVVHMHPRMAMKVAQHKIVNLLKTLWIFFVITHHNVFNVWPKTTLLLPLWPRDTKRLDIPVSRWLSHQAHGCSCASHNVICSYILIAVCIYLPHYTVSSLWAATCLISSPRWYPVSSRKPDIE